MIRSAAAMMALMVCGVTTAATINVPGNYSTIQAAVDAASNGDEIIVAPGTYFGSGSSVVNTLGKAITIKASGTPEATIIHGQGARRVINCASGEGADTAIEGFTIMGGFATSSSGGGIFFAGGSSPTITGCTISNNTATADGGGIFCDSYSNPTMTDCVISNNIATRGGGLFCETSQHLGSPPTLISCTISNNTAQYGGGLGVWGTLTLNDCLVWLNTAANDGGGVWLIGSDNTTISGCTISANTASVRGGGVYHYSAGTDSSPTITACTISGNTASTGGGVYRYDSIGSLTLTDTVVCGNDPDQIVGDWADGGGNFVAEVCGPSWIVDDDGPADFDNIQAAIDAASAGSVILVEPGTYTGTGNEVVNTLGKAITIRASGTPEETIIDGEGARRVVLCSSGEGADTVIEGFTITGGSSSGGGIYCYNSSPTITDCTISGNTGGNYGGGIYCRDSSPTITDCTITDNSANYDGGGIYCKESSPTITDCTITDNSANYDGGGIYCKESSPTISGCTISDNTTTWSYDGGGIYCSSSSPTITDCTISGNIAGDSGGGIYCRVSSSPTITGCTISDNIAVGSAGGIMCISNSSATISGCTISNNTTNYIGGGIYCHYSSPTISGCTISGNQAAQSVGGIYCLGDSSPTLIDTALCGNASGNIHGSWTDGGGVCLATWCTDSDDDGILDECDDQVGDGIHEVPGEIEHIAEAVAVANDGDTVLVAPGTYTGTGDWVINPFSKSITIRATGTPEETIIDGEGARRVVLCSSGEGADTVIEGFTITGGSADKGGGIYCSSSSPTITGCTITDNTATGDDAVGGGGIYCSSSSPTITDCTITDNTATGDDAVGGGGIYCISNSSPTITDCTISGNAATGDDDVKGGGIYCSSSSPTITGCTITDNTATGDARNHGGGIYCSSSSPTITDCTISGNTAQYGGGIFCDEWSSSPTISGCTISNNTAYSGGGIFFAGDSSPTITGCMISNNTATADGGGIFCDEWSSSTLSDTVVCGNAPGNIFGSWTNGGGMCLAYSCQDSDGNDVPDECEGSIGDGIHEVPSEYATVQEAINAAGYGDTVLVAPGTYTGTGDWVINPLGKPITIRATGTPEETIIDGQGASAGIQCVNGETSSTLIYGLTIQNCGGTTGAGMLCDGSSPNIVMCIFTGNTAYQGGGIACRNGAAPSLIDCEITGNDASGSDGGGVWVSSAEITLITCDVSANTADNDGGGIYLSSATANLHEINVAGNTADYGGGLFGYASTVTMTNAIVENNFAAGDGSNATDGGGGISMDGGDWVIDGCLVQDNYSLANAGGILSNQASVTIDHSTVRGNTASTLAGGVYSQGSMYVANTAICSNTPSQIIGAHVDGGGNSISILCQANSAACCLPLENMCLLAEEPDCTYLGGQWLGEGTTCVGDPCDIAPPICPADIDHNQTIDTSDLLLVLYAWGGQSDSADVNGDGLVSVADLLEVLSQWGPCE